MEIIYMPRGFGKTTNLIHMSGKNNIPILCLVRENARYISEKAKEMDLTIPNPLYVENKEIYEFTPIYKDQILIEKGKYPSIYVDDADFLLQRLLGIHIDAIALSGNQCVY